MKMCYQCGTQLSYAEAQANCDRIDELVEADEAFAEQLPVHCRPAPGESLESGAIVLCTKCIEQARKGASADWVVMDGNTSSLSCRRCGDSYKPTLPIDVRLFVALSNEYVKIHRACAKPKNEAPPPQATGIPEVGRRDDPKYQVRGQMTVNLEREPEVKPRGVRQFICEVCEQEFPRTDLMLKHDCTGPNHEFVTDVDMVKLAGLSDGDVDLYTLVEAVKAHVPGRAYGRSPFSSHHIQAVKDRDALAFALLDLVRAIDAAEPLDKARDAAYELLTACCPGCRGRYTETEKHTCTKEGM